MHFPKSATASRHAQFQNRFATVALQILQRITCTNILVLESHIGGEEIDLNDGWILSLDQYIIGGLLPHIVLSSDCLAKKGQKNNN